MTSQENYRFFGAGLAAKAVRACLAEAKVVRIAASFFEPSGWELLADLLEDKETRLLLGREEGASDKIEDLLEEFFAEIQQGYNSTPSKVLNAILKALRKGKLTIKVSRKKLIGSLDVRYRYHHAKLYIADEKQLIVTSANFTRSGLKQSCEAGYLVTQLEDVQYFVAKFDAFFAQSKSLTEDFIEILEELLKLCPPKDIYHRTLLELYGLPYSDCPSKLLEPAPYQNPIIARLVRSITDYGGAFLVASTGLGKTIIAGHVAAQLRQNNVIRTVTVIAPAGLRDMWRQNMRSAGISSREYSYHTLSSKNWQKSRRLMQLMDELKQDVRGMLIILDESHHMRNEEDSEGELKLRHERIHKAVAEKGAKLLLLTATPYSRSIADINNQLALLPSYQKTKLFPDEKEEWQVTKPAELSELPPCTVLTLPTVIKYFSQAEQGRYYIQFGNLKRYFPKKIYLKTIEFHNPMNDILNELFNSKLLYRLQSQPASQQEMFEETNHEGKRDPLFEAHLLHQFCSSPAQVKSTLDKLSRENGFSKMRFHNQKELSKFVQPLKEETLPKLPDLKLKQLIDLILKEHPQEKIVIFCIYHETAHYLKEKLSKCLPNHKVATTVGLDEESIETHLATFAPIANGKLSPENPDDYFSKELKKQAIDILIVSEAISEGYNLQDARILINYDLPWSVLHLAQRMGRIMRPWHEVRDIYIYNFLPDTMFEAPLKHGQRWYHKLDQRNREHTSFTKLPVMSTAGDESVDLYHLRNALKDNPSIDLEFTEAMEFVSTSMEIETSSVLADLANLTAEESKRLTNLRLGFRSRVHTSKSDEPALFLLIQKGSLVFPTLFKKDGTFFTSPEELTTALKILRDYSESEIYSDNFDPVALDKLQEQCLQNWLNHLKEERSKVRIICALHFAS